MAPRRCPLCRRVSEEHVAQCGCGYTFGQTLGQARAQVRQQLGLGAAAIFGGAALVALSAALVVITYGLAYMVALGIFSSGVVAIVRGSGLVSRSRHSLRELPEMPVARALPPRAPASD